MKKRIIAACICGCMLLSLTACTTKKEPEKETTSESKKESEKEKKEKEAQKRIQTKLDMIDPTAYANIEGLDLEKGTYFSLIGKGHSEEYWTMVKAGAVAAVDQLNEHLEYKGKDKIKVVYSGPGDSTDVDEQVNILDEELSRYPSALGVALIDSKSCNVQFDLATENGIPIVIFDSASSYQGIMSEISTDNQAAARETATHMAEELKDQGKVLVIGHDSKSVTSRERTESFVDEMKLNHSQMETSEIYYMDQLTDLKREIVSEQVLPEEVDAEMEKVTEEQVCEYILEKNPDAQGVYATDGMTTMKFLSAAESVNRENLSIMGFDGDKEVIKALEEGRIKGFVLQNPYGMGYATIVAEARCVLGMGNEAKVNTGYVWVTKQNIGKKEIQRLLSL